MILLICKLISLILISDILKNISITNKNLYAQFIWDALNKQKENIKEKAIATKSPYHFNFEMVQASILYRSKEGSRDCHKVIIASSYPVWKTKLEITICMKRSITTFRSEELLTFKIWAHFYCCSDLILRWFTTCCLWIGWSTNNLYSENLKWKRNTYEDTNVSCSDVIA